jgi:hypothetical protein
MSRAARVANARISGLDSAAAPVRSIAPSSRPERGSKMEARAVVRVAASASCSRRTLIL